MKAAQVDEALREKFLTQKHRLVFWSDVDGEFADYVARGLPEDLADVTLIDLSSAGGLPTKLRLEREDPTGRYLLYRSGESPPASQDWLFDIRLYSAEFHADIASIWVRELGLRHLHFRDHLRSRAVFMGSKERRKRLKRLLSEDDDAEAIDLKMMAVLAGSDVATLLSIVPALCQRHVEGARFDLQSEPKVMLAMEKMGLAEKFWQLVKRDLCFVQEKPRLAALLRGLFVSEFLHQVGDATIDSIAHFRLPPAGRQNALVCLTQWRDSGALSEGYDAVAQAISSDLNLEDHLEPLSVEQLRGAFTFWAIETQLARRLRTRVLDEFTAVDADDVGELANERIAGHWLSGPARDMGKRPAVRQAYRAVVAAAELFSLHAKCAPSLEFDDAAEMFGAYRDELFQYDRLYREFCERAAAMKGKDLLKELRDRVEDVYSNGFLGRMGVESARLLDAGFLGEWSLEEFPAQQLFYQREIAPYLRQDERKRAYVIISDALRYEAAHQLADQLNGEYRITAKIDAMLGVLPSYTTLGMASLLPHEQLTYAETGDVLVDGKSVAGTELRNKQLAKVDGMACQAKDLLKMKLEEVREFTRDRRVVYIYHNVIDARGDTASTEHETFSAVEQCLGELVDLVKVCVNKLNAATVWVTADHGFLYRDSSPKEFNKSKLAEKPAHAVKQKKRYVLGRGLGDTAEAHHGKTSVTAGTSDDMEFWIPRGTSRFHFAGGARFVHGGAMPQEVVVPLITVSHLRDKHRPASRVKKVAVQVLGANHRITAPQYRFKFIQTEAVGDRREPLTLKVAVYDGAQPVTSVEQLVFDSSSSDIGERQQSVRLVLISGQFDKAKPYRLVLRDAETDTEVQSVPVVIDRSFDDDF